MKTKYNFEISAVVVTADINRLTSQTWKLIPMRENGEDWASQLQMVILEIVGLHEIFIETEKYLILLSKLEGLAKSETDFPFYRKTVFEAISLLRGLLK